MLEAGVYYLEAYNWFSSNTNDDFTASFAMAKEICSALLKEPAEIVKLLERSSEVCFDPITHAFPLSSDYWR